MLNWKEVNKMCNICGNDRCIGKYLLHPAEFGIINGLKKHELETDNTRTFELVDSPSSGEIFTRFKELHVIAGPNEDMNNIKKTPPIALNSLGLKPRGSISIIDANSLVNEEDKDELY